MKKADISFRCFQVIWEEQGRLPGLFPLLPGGSGSYDSHRSEQEIRGGSVCEGKRNADFGQGSCKRDFGPDSAGKSSWVLFGLPGEGELAGGASDKAGVQEAKRNVAGHCRA